MQDKKHDNFFDEDTEQKSSEQKLMDMVDQYAPKQTSVEKGAKVSGKVVRVGSSHVFVDIGAKNEAAMKLGELQNDEGELAVQEGDTVSGYVVSGTEGELLISKSMVSKSGGTEELYDAMKEKLPVSGKITGINKGGLNVKIMGKRAFCPASQVDIKFVDDLNVYFGRTMDFVISRITEGGRNIVVSRVPLLEGDLEERLAQLEKESEEKKTIRGTVSRIAPFGLFVDIGQIEGLVHISEVAWDRVENLEELFEVGQQVDVVVLGLERKSPLRDTKVSLSIKQVEEDPWTTVADRFTAGTTVEGTVTRLADFGAFVRIASGIEGLVHISELSWGKRIRHPQDVLEVGQRVSVAILEIHSEKNEVSLSLKETQVDPWSTIDQRHPIGSTVRGTVASQTRFGFFVDIEEGVTGLLVHSNVAPEKKSEVKVQEEIEAKVVSIDKERRRMGLAYGVETEESSEESVREYMEQAQEPAASSGSFSEFGEALRNAMKHKKG